MFLSTVLLYYEKKIYVIYHSNMFKTKYLHEILEYATYIHSIIIHIFTCYFFTIKLNTVFPLL